MHIEVFRAIVDEGETVRRVAVGLHVLIGGATLIFLWLRMVLGPIGVGLAISALGVAAAIWFSIRGAWWWMVATDIWAVVLGLFGVGFFFLDLEMVVLLVLAAAAITALSLAFDPSLWTLAGLGSLADQSPRTRWAAAATYGAAALTATIGVAFTLLSVHEPGGFAGFCEFPSLGRRIPPSHVSRQAPPCASRWLLILPGGALISGLVTVAALVRRWSWAPYLIPVTTGLGIIAGWLMLLLLPMGGGGVGGMWTSLIFVAASVAGVTSLSHPAIRSLAGRPRPSPPPPTNP